VSAADVQRLGIARVFLDDPGQGRDILLLLLIGLTLGRGKLRGDIAGLTACKAKRRH